MKTSLSLGISFFVLTSQTMPAQGAETLPRKDPRFIPTVNLQLDSVSVHGDSDVPSNTNFRRFRLGAKGDLRGDTRYKVEFDFANQDVGITDLFAQYDISKFLTISVGQMKEPFNLETYESDPQTRLIETSAISTFSPGRHLGAMLSTSNKHYSAAFGVFGRRLTGNSTNDDTLSYTGRVTYAPINEDNTTIHLGLAATHRIPENRNNTLKFSAVPETRSILGFSSIDTKSITHIDHMDAVGLEFASSYRSFSVQSEAIRTELDRKDGFNDLTFQGAYAEVAYFLTGEHRGYDSKRGTFAKVKPIKGFLKGSGIGAFEAVGRVAYLDLDDGSVAGGKTTAYSAGLNWFLRSDLKLSSEVTYLDNSYSNKADTNDTITGFRLSFYF